MFFRSDSIENSYVTGCLIQNVSVYFVFLFHRERNFYFDIAPKYELRLFRRVYENILYCKTVCVADLTAGPRSEKISDETSRIRT